MRFTVSAVAAAVLIVLIIGAVTLSKPESQDEVSLPANNLSLNIVKTTSDQSANMTRIRAEDGNSTFVVNRYHLQDFREDFIKSRFRTLSSIYNPAPVPYRGVKTPDVQCDVDLSRRQDNIGVGGTNYTLVEMYADSSYQKKACPAENRYRLHISLFQCPESQSVYEIEVFTPQDSNLSYDYPLFSCR
ncbi:MAG: hypothetical protein ABEJ99_02175 [Candidatus Nanohaloarchaea archaeon]